MAPLLHRAAITMMILWRERITSFYYLQLPW